MRFKNTITLLYSFIPLLALAQLKEFEVSEMPRPDVSVVQANKDFPEDALLLVYSSIRDLNFRSSLGGIDKVTFNPSANRYEILVRPLKQMVFVYHKDYMEAKIATINPSPKDVLYYKAEEREKGVVSTESGTLRITTEPNGADIFLNGMRMADKTPFSGELNPGGTRIRLQKAKHETLDTLIAIRGGENTVFSVRLRPATLWVNISSTPSGADVSLDGTSRGKTPASFEMDLTDASKRGSMPVRLTLADHETVSTTVDLRPSATPLELDYSLKKQKGSFSITSTPDGAQVFIGGQYKGTTPLQGSMEVGQYEVEVKLEDYNAPKQTMTVKAGDAARASYAMRDLSSATCIDPAGREYHTVQIGDQLWMAENLAFKPPSGEYWAYDNDLNNVAKYGYLYDWRTAKKVCPDGWHLPSNEEWTTLTDYLGGGKVAGTKMKSRTGWRDKGNGTDSSGFSGLPGGYRDSRGTFSLNGKIGNWWSSTEDNTYNAWNSVLYYKNSDVNRGKDYKVFGFSVRCLRD
jgi:uncharacterized protein (TIGR02145 family)